MNMNIIINTNLDVRNKVKDVMGDRERWSIHVVKMRNDHCKAGILHNYLHSVKTRGTFPDRLRDFTWKIYESKSTRVM